MSDWKASDWKAGAAKTGAARWRRIRAALRGVRLAREPGKTDRTGKTRKTDKPYKPDKPDEPGRPDRLEEPSPFEMPQGHVVRPYLTVAAILSRPSQAFFRYEWRQIAGFPPEDWRKTLEHERPHLVMAEAVPDGSKWAEQLAGEPGTDLTEMLEWCREQGIRTVLWGRPADGGRVEKLFEHVYEPRKPYIQPRIHNPVPLPEGRTEETADVPRLTGSYAALLAAYRRPRLVVGDPDEQVRAELAACMTPVADAGPEDPFFEMRRVHAEHSLTPQVDAMLEAAGLPSVRSPQSVTAVLPVTSPSGLEHALGQLGRQRRRPGQLVILAYGWRPAIDAGGFDDILIFPAGGTEPPGAALNNGMAAADGDLIALVREEDHYGPHYFDDLVRTFTYTEAGVAGKRSHYVRDGGSEELREPGHEHRYTDRVAAGTLLVRRDVLRDARFDAESGDPVGTFLDRCRSENVLVWSADRHSYLGVPPEG